MGDVSFDFHELDLLAADLGAQPAEIAKFIPVALARTARNVKDAWNGKLYTDGHAKRTGHSVTYDLDKVSAFGATVFRAEIGAVRGSGRQAYITRLLEYGSAHNPPHGAGAGALQENQADFEKGIAEAASDALKARRL